MTSMLLVARTWAGDGDAQLAETDAAMNRAKDLTIHWTVADQQPGAKAPRPMAFTVRVKGNKSLTTFEEPADQRGTRVLVLARDQMWVWLPAYNKVRRIASHVTQQSFMGTSYSQDDMNATRFADVYEARRIAEGDNGVTLELLPKPGALVPYPKVQVTVGGDDYPTELRYFNAQGTHIKTETRKDYECRGTVCLPGVMRIEDLTRPGAWTELRRTSWEVDQGLSNDLFTVRTLQMGI
jgi:hypothetical protein